MIIDLEETIAELKDRQLNILTGLADKSKDLTHTNFERGRYAELKSILSVLEDRAADYSSRYIRS